MNITAPKYRTGLTLLELLLVVFILSTIALSAVSLVDRVDEQSRFEETKRRWQEIRVAIVGDPNKTINGEAAISGFVADVGRLPLNIQELIEQGDLPAWQFNTATGIWSGWRGPYLNAVVEAKLGLPAYRDGWGNSGEDENFGWKIFFADQVDNIPSLLPDGITPIADGAVLLQSFGSDQSEGTGGNSIYEADYPPYNATTNTGLLIRREDHQININTWPVTIQLENINSTSLPGSDVNLKLRIHYPIDGVITGFVDSESVALISADVSTEISANGYYRLTFVFPPDDTFIPWGVRSFQFIEDDGDNDDTNDVVYSFVEAYQTINLIPRQQLPIFSGTSPLIWQLE